MDKEESKQGYSTQIIDAFDEEFLALTTQCRKIVESKLGVANIGIGSGNPIITCLTKYLTVYKAVGPESHIIYFVQLFNANRTKILDTLKDDSWLATDKIAIQFGEHLKEVMAKPNAKQYRIMLGTVYTIAVELKKVASANVLELDPLSVNEDLIRCEIIMLHLFRIFYYVIDTNDKPAIGEILAVMEHNLRTPKRVAPSKNPAAPSANPAEAGMAGMPDMSGLFGIAKGFMAQSGMAPGPGAPDINEKEFGQFFQKMFSSIGPTMTNLTQQMANGADPVTAMGQVFKPETFQQIFGNMGGMIPQQNPNVSSSSSNITVMPDVSMPQQQFLPTPQPQQSQVPQQQFLPPPQSQYQQQIPQQQIPQQQIPQQFLPPTQQQYQPSQQAHQQQYQQNPSPSPQQIQTPSPQPQQLNQPMSQMRLGQ